MGLLITKAEFGSIVWLTKEELKNEVVKKEIDRLKSCGRVAVFCAGSQDAKQVIKRLIEQRISAKLQ